MIENTLSMSAIDEREKKKLALVSDKFPKLSHRKG